MGSAVRTAWNLVVFVLIKEDPVTTLATTDVATSKGNVKVPFKTNPAST